MLAALCYLSVLSVSVVEAVPTFTHHRDTDKTEVAQRVSKPQVSAAVTITTEPNAIIWIDEIRRGVTDASGVVEIRKISSGRHVLRVRAIGFKEASVPLVAGRRSLAVKLIKTTDRAELLFQQAEDARDKARDDPARQQAAELYRQTLKLRQAFPAAHVGLARVLLDLNQYQEALNEIEAARRTRPSYAEASAVEGRINREAAFTDEAIKSFRRSIREGRGFQPEAHVGLARVLEDKGQYDEAIAEFRKAIDQLSDSEPKRQSQLMSNISRWRQMEASHRLFVRSSNNCGAKPPVRKSYPEARAELPLITVQ
jgi:tetratricopeptide (TPR) repeat protein